MQTNNSVKQDNINTKNKKINSFNSLYNKINSEMYDKNLTLIVEELDLNKFEKSIFTTRIN